MKENLLKTIDAKYPLKSKSAGEFASLKVNGMKFRIEAYEAEGLGHVSYMQAKGFFGLMKMDTMIVVPDKVDLPLYSYDRILAMGNDTLICELYDTCVSPFSSPSLTEVCREASSLPDRDPGVHWYDDIRMKESLSKKGKKNTAGSFDKTAENHFSAWLSSEVQPLEDPEDKKKKTVYYVNGLLTNGGPSTSVFLKALGHEKTEELFQKVLFGTL